MNRRELVTTVGGTGTMLLGGCLGVDSSNETAPTDTDEQDTTENPTTGPQFGQSDAALQFGTICANEVERSYFSYEYLTVENPTREPQNLSGYTVQYGSNKTYQITDLTLEPGAQLTIRSRRGNDTVLQSYPPIYVRHAGFGERSNTSVLGENGTVYLTDPDGTTVSKHSYENYGCDGSD